MKPKILIVDDVEMSRFILRDVLQEQYEVVEACNGVEALKIIHQDREAISAVIMDLRMPEMDGYQVCETLKNENLIKEIPVLILTSDISLESEIRCFDMGCYDFIRKPFSNALLLHRLENAVLVHSRRMNLEKDLEARNKELEAAYERVQGKATGLQQELEETIEVLGSLGEYRSYGHDAHMHDMKSYTRIIGTKYMEIYPDSGLNQELLDQIVMCCPLHNVGKIELPERVVMKPGKLTNDEFALMKSHTSRGAELIQNIKSIWNSEYSQICFEICKYHHERYDGRGYPAGLSGDAIPISAQLVGIADVYDALINDTTYRKALPKDRAFSMIMNEECGVFAPKLLEAFRQVQTELEAVKE